MKTTKKASKTNCTNLKSFFPLFQFQICHAAQTKVADNCFLVVEMDVFTLEILVDDTSMVKITKGNGNLRDDGLKLQKKSGIKYYKYKM